MSRKLEELLNLPENEKFSNDDTILKPIIPPDNLFRDYAEFDKIAASLPKVSGLGDMADSELDELAQKATDAYDDLMDLGMNVEPRYSSRLFEVASTMLKSAIDAKTVKIDKKIKMIDLQLKKQKLDEDEAFRQFKLAEELKLEERKLEGADVYRQFKLAEELKLEERKLEENELFRKKQLELEASKLEENELFRKKQLELEASKLEESELFRKKQLELEASKLEESELFRNKQLEEEMQFKLQKHQDDEVFRNKKLEEDVKYRQQLLLNKNRALANISEADDEETITGHQVIVTDRNSLLAKLRKLDSSDDNG